MWNSALNTASAWLHSNSVDAHHNDDDGSSSWWNDWASLLVMYFLYWSLGGWTLALATSARLLIPDSQAAWDRLIWCCQFKSGYVWIELRLVRQMILRYLVVVPLHAYCWTVDEIFFRGYHSMPTNQPLIIMSAPRTGTTSFQQTMELDERLITPRLIELVAPFLFLHKIIYRLARNRPRFFHWMEDAIVRNGGVTDEVFSRHPIAFMCPESDDVLLGEIHYVSPMAGRTFPSPELLDKMYRMGEVGSHCRKRALQLQHAIVQKIIYHRGRCIDTKTGHVTGYKRLLLRSHLAPCTVDYARMYPDATFVGMFRNPVDTALSTISLSFALVKGAHNLESRSAEQAERVLQIFKARETLDSIINMVATMLSLEAALFSGETMRDMQQGKYGDSKEPVQVPGIAYTTFQQFIQDPVECFRRLYAEMNHGSKSPDDQQQEWSMTDQFERAIRDQLQHHATYKKRQRYKNPTFTELGIDPNELLLSRPGVQDYVRLMVDKIEKK